jgi:hypothetical protein
LANRRGDVVLHVNPRLNDRQLVLNSAPGGGWGAEERKPLGITRGHQFSIIIMVTEQGFKVKLIYENKSKIFFVFSRSLLTINIQLIFLIECLLMQLN